jgi:hypothetical protein
MTLFLSILGLVAAVLFLAFYIIALSFMLWMAVDAGKHDRFWWIVLIIALPLVGAVAYFVTEKKHLYKKVTKHTEEKEATSVQETA